MIIEDQAFSQSYDSALRLSPPPPFPQQVASLSLPSSVSVRGGKGMGEEPNRTTARKPGPL
jgi:hypothetical protein